MSRHGRPGQRVSASSPRRVAASLITCSLRSTAATVLTSARNVPASIPSVNCLIAAIASAMSRKESDGSLKGKHGLVCGPVCDGLLQSVRWREIDGRAEEVGYTVLKAHHIEQRQMPRGIEIGDQINVRCCR